MRKVLFLIVCIFSFTALFAEKTEKACGCTPQQFSKLFSQVAKKASLAVVNIRAEGGSEDEGIDPYQSQAPDNPFSDDFFNRFFGAPYRKVPKQSVSQGSGFFASPSGHILTNAHVVKGSNKITVVLHDGREMPAEIVGIDPSTDVGVLKVEGSGFDFLPLGNSEEADIGEWVIAIGSPFQLQATVTVGVISATGRQNLRITDFEDFIQTDAAINPGNSGGPLINLQGQAIGINTAIVSKSGASAGIGFAIPSNMAQHVMNQLIDNGTVTRGFLGIVLQPIDQDMADAFNLEKPEGALVAEVVKGSPADKGGLKQGDIILQYDNTPVKTIGSFRNQISMIKPGTTVKLKINRNGKIMTLSIVLGSHSDEIGGSGYSKKLGMEVETLTPDLSKKLGYSQAEEGVVITKIKPGSPAALAGMRPGFLILAINHKKVTTVEDFQKALEETKNNRVLILAKQGSSTRFFSIKIQ